MNEPTASSSGLSTGAIVGIAIGAIVLVAVIALIVYCLCCTATKGSETVVVMNDPETGKV